MERHKVESYVGFAVKARKILLGATAVESGLKRVKLILICGTAQKNTIKKANSLSVKTQAPMVFCRGKQLAEITGKPNVKIAAVTDKSLSKAIVEHCDEKYFYVQPQKRPEYPEEDDEFVYGKDLEESGGDYANIKIVGKDVFKRKKYPSCGKGKRSFGKTDLNRSSARRGKFRYGGATGNEEGRNYSGGLKKSFKNRKSGNFSSEDEKISGKTPSYKSGMKGHGKSRYNKSSRTPVSAGKPRKPGFDKKTNK